MKRRTRFSRAATGLIAVSAGLALLAGCAQPETPEGPVESVGKVTIGIGSDPATAVYVIADQQGIFAANGVESEVRQFASGGEALAAEVSGEIQLASVTEPPFLGAFDKGAELGVLGTIAVSDENFGAVGAADITEPEDLTRDGVRVGVTENSGAHYFLQRYADANGFSLDDVDLAYLQVSDLVASFSRGDVQAIFTWTPNVQQAEAAVDGAHILAYSGDVDFPTTMYVVSTNDLIGDKALSDAVMKSLVEAAAWIQDNPDEALQILSDTFSVPTDALELPMSLFDYKVDLTQAQSDSFVSVAEWMQAAGLISEVPDPADFLSPDALSDVDPSLVSFGS